MEEHKPRRDLDGLQRMYPCKCTACKKDIILSFEPTDEPYCPACWGKKLKK